MTHKILRVAGLVVLCASAAGAQDHPRRAPIYRVTVVDRTVSAVDYQYRTGPTAIDFRGTVLLPGAKGGAVVESKSGRVEIDAKFDHLPAPTRYGREYLTYVLWAITPEGRAKNLGEILPGSSDKAHLRVTTDLQAFGLIVTAEPYSAVRLPSDVVVLENAVRPDTNGPAEPIQAKYELLPRGHYTYEVPESMAAAEGSGPRLSMDEYQQVLELYQARNAVQIAEAAGAGQYAPDVLDRAEALLRQAEEAHHHGAGTSAVVTIARQASEGAEDARILATDRRQRQELAAARAQAASADRARAQAEAAAQTAQTEALASQALLEQERAARRQAEARAAAPLPPASAPIVEARPAAPADARVKTETRMRLLRELGIVLPARDTPRGLVLTVSASDFRQAEVAPAAAARLARLPAILRAQPGLAVEVDGFGSLSTERAYSVMNALTRDGVPMREVTARGFGDSRPLVSNATAAGREQNTRVEIVVSGNPIGQLPYWAKTYRILPQ